MSVYRNHPGAYELDNAPNPLTGEKWGGYYCRHVGALTEEDMHSKAEIAAELAHRDLQIDNLRAELAELRHFRKVIMDYDSNLYDALADSDAAHKGEEE
jgi:hypothetical protein